MPEIHSPDPGRKLADRYKLVGPGPTPFLSPEIVPVAIVDDLTESDVFSTEFERTAVGLHTVTAVVAQFAAVDLNNPAGSNLLFIVEDIVFNGSGSQELRFGLLASSGDVATATRVQWRDGRVSGDPRGQLFGSNPVGAPTFPDARFMILNEPNLLPLKYVVNPGVMLRVIALTANTTIQITIYWRERAIQTRRAGAGGIGGGL